MPLPKPINMPNPTIVTGHYGSGKTEFCVNYAAMLGEKGEAPTLADMDIVNAYFRSRLLKDRLAHKGVQVISNNMEREYYNDTPALAASLYACFEKREQRSIIDVGGDPEGARVLARFAHLLQGVDYDMWLTVNANRMRTQTEEEVLEYIEMIEQASKLKITGLINTTHMLRETAKEDIMKGDALVREVSVTTNLPIIYTVVPRFLAEELADEDVAAEIFPVDLLMRPDYL